ncbi:hypothetical protein [Salinimicrobium marinum]|nr:hypothetical protein [Salinimicrobium marinum]
MLLEKINLQRELEKYRKKDISEEDILEQVKYFLQAEEDKEREIMERIHQGGFSEGNGFDPNLLIPGKVFHISHIKNICVNYRLRFLDTKYFKAGFPPEALSEIKDLEKIHNTPLHGFQIVAPSKNFRLKNADDPLLFAPIGNGYYYLIHKWGNDLNPFRKILMWPLKNIENLLVFTVIFSFSLTFLLRAVFFSHYQATSEFIMLFLFSFKSMVGLMIFYGVALGKNFSSGIWNSKYFNG